VSTTLSMTATWIPAEPMGDDDKWEHNSWEIVLSFEGRTMTMKFHTGLAFTGPPEIGAVLSSLALDASSMSDGETFEQWADNFGYDTDSRKAEHTYQACKEQAVKLRELLGDYLETIIYHAPNDGDWSEFKGSSIELPDAG
jgi:hypothetical protein